MDLNSVPNIGGNSKTKAILDAPNAKCSKCGGIIFDAHFLVKKISGLMANTGSDNILYPMKILSCAKCGHILDDDIKMYKLDIDEI